MFGAVSYQPARQIAFESSAMQIELIGPEDGVAIPESLRSDTPEDRPSEPETVAAPTPPPPVEVRQSPSNIPAPEPLVWRPPAPPSQTVQRAAPVAAVTAPPPPSTGRSEAAPAAATPAQPTRAGPPAGGVVNSPVSLSGAAGDSYGARVRAHLEAHKIYPRGARRLRQTGVVTVSFIIDREGRVLSSRIVSGSGVRALDEEALDMLTRASPVPRPPAGVEGARIQMRTPVEFSLDD